MKSWEELGIDDDYIFGKVMQDPELCKKLIEIILDIEVKKIEYPEKQKAIRMTADAKSVRLDVYTTDGNSVYNIEMQTTNNGGLPLRSRYYQGMVDLNLIEKGAPYTDLKKSFIIFICTFDPFGKNLYRYRFENICREDSRLCLNDGATKVFLNARGTKGDISEELKKFLDYVANGPDIEKTSFTEAVDKAVTKAKENKEWKVEYMTLLMRDQENIQRGREENAIYMIKNLMVNLNLSLEEAMKAVSVPEEQWEKFKKLLNE